MLLVENVSHYYNKKICLSDINISAQQGEVICLVGSSGCGKSTLLRIISGLENPYSGRISIDNKLVFPSIIDTSPAERSVSLMLQNYALFPHLTVLENITFCLNIKDKKEKHNKALGALKMIDMENYADYYPDMLSGGQQQRVALARVLVLKPKIVLLDESFSNLDGILRSALRKSTLALFKENNITVIMVTHEPEEALLVADYIYVMDKGKIIQSGKAEDLYNKPCNKYVASFFGHVNIVQGIIKDGKAITILGDYDANNLKNGSKIDLVIRSEALSVAQDSKLKAVIKGKKFLGTSTLMNLILEDSDVELIMKLKHKEISQIKSDNISLEVDKSKLYIFNQEEV